MPGQSFPNQPYTTVSQTPGVDEKPYLYIDSLGNWNVFVPSSNGGATILQTADVNGIRIGGLLFDAGTANSSVLVQIGPPRVNRQPRVGPDRAL